MLESFFGRSLLAFTGLLLASGPAVAAPIIFDDFDTNEGHFGYAPNFSGTSVGESSMSTADRVLTDGPLEGAGHQKLVLVHDGSATNLRIRHVSGGPPYNSTNAGAAAANTVFTTDSTVNAFIGFYMKTTAAGITVAINLDDSTGTGAGMDMGKAKPLIADGKWHLYEWQLNDPAQWDPVAGIGGDGTVQDGTHSIDSIYIFGNSTGANGEAKPDIFLDFVAMNDAGSVAQLVPEPGSAGLLVVAGGVLLLRRGRNLRALNVVKPA